MVINILALFQRVSENKILIFPIVVALMVIYFVNRFYLLIYKNFPRKIRAEKDRIICEDFVFDKNRNETILYKDIVSIKGGIFDGKLSGLMKITDKNNLSIAFSDRISDSTKLIAKILEKVDKKIYDDVIENLKLLCKKLSSKVSKKVEI
jgi:hypothetical protein